MRFVALTALIASLLAGCAVARPDDLEERLWTCGSAPDCIDGWGCADGSVLREDFCRPACDPEDESSCDGVCTRTGECLATCVIWGDATSPCPDGHVCVRTDLLGDEGVCFPAPSCSRTDECGEGSACFNDVFALPSAIPGVEYASDHLYCVAVPDESDRCPTGYLLVPGLVEGSASTCLPRCDSDGSRCPPDLVCLDDLGFLFAQPGTSPCYPGYWGVPCDDDAQCMLGRCLDVGEGRRACTFGCADADRTFGQLGGGCGALEDAGRALRLDALAYECEVVEGERVCVPRGTAGAPCNAEMLCADGLECRAFSSGGNVVRFCSRDCVDAGDCEVPGALITAYCQRSAAGGSCVPRSFEGGACASPEQCRPGLVCREARCVSAL